MSVHTQRGLAAPTCDSSPSGLCTDDVLRELGKVRTPTDTVCDEQLHYECVIYTEGGNRSRQQSMFTRMSVERNRELNIALTSPEGQLQVRCSSLYGC